MLAIVAGLFAAYQWTQSHYYVGVDDGRVAIFQGVQQNIGPDRAVARVPGRRRSRSSSLPSFQQESVEATINADNLRDAIDIVNRLDDLAGD